MAVKNNRVIFLHFLHVISIDVIGLRPHGELNVIVAKTSAPPPPPSTLHPPTVPVKELQCFTVTVQASQLFVSPGGRAAAMG